MKCQELFNILSVEEYVHVWEEGIRQKIAAHICACTLCCKGITRLSAAVIVEDVLTCDACRGSLPGYYEATHIVQLPITLAEVDVVQIAIHLGHCAACTEEYCVLVELWDEEELP